MRDSPLQGETHLAVISDLALEDVSKAMDIVSIPPGFKQEIIVGFH